MAVIVVIILVTSAGRTGRTGRGPGPARLLTGIAAGDIDADLVLGGENLWRVGRQPRQLARVWLHDGLSPLLPLGHGAQVDQLAPVRGGVVAHISDTAAGITYGAVGRVVFIPAAHAPVRVIGRATMIAVAPGGQQVWVQTAIQRPDLGRRAAARSRSPTWAVNLAGRRVSPVLRLPFGLVGATGQGPLTQNLVTLRLQLWDRATGRPLPLPRPATGGFAAAAQDRLVWVSSAPSGTTLHITDLRTGSAAALPLPRNWGLPPQTFPPPTASFDPAGRRLALSLNRADATGIPSAQALFILDTSTRTVRMIPTQPLPLGDTLAGAWDQLGRLWILAASPYSGYYQLGFWTGTGPLHTLPATRGAPIALSAPGPGR